MKKFFIFAVLLCGAICFSACNSDAKQEEKKEGKKFAPKEKQSSMTQEERTAAIAERKASLVVNVDSIMMLDGVKFSVLPPTVNAETPQQASEMLVTRLISIAAQNGIGGLPTNPVLGLVTRVERTESSLTGTAPQKAVVKYEVTTYCGNFISNEIYASATTALTGVGNTVEQAAIQAFRQLQNTPQLKDMMKKASENAIKWYDNKGNIERIVNEALSEKNYPLAMALLSSVPSQSSSFDYAIKRDSVVSGLYFESKADDLYASMKAAIVAAQSEYSPEPGAYFQLIPQTAKVYAEALKDFNQYKADVEADRRDKIARERAVEDRDAAYAHQLAMEELAVEKIKAPFESAATIAQINANARVEAAKASNTGGFLGLGKFWDHTANFTNKLFFKE